MIKFFLFVGVAMALFTWIFEPKPREKNKP
jgi:hypothetical protein